MDKKSKIIAVDFDGCLVTNKWPEIGEPIWKNINKLKEEQKNGSKIILWTCRVGVRLAEALKFCDGFGIHFDSINENLPMINLLHGGDSRKIFADEYWDDRAVLMDESEECESNMSSWAEREIEIACKHERAGNETPDGEWDYGCACYESALKAFRSLTKDGHSGFSIGTTKHILNRLIDGKPLTPIEDVPESWNDVSDRSGLKGEEVNYQCRRMSSLFKYVYADGTIKYRDIDAHYCIDVNSGSTYHSGLVQRLIDEMFPITMPYMPPNSPMKVYCEEFLTDRKNGDFDTVGILYAVKPDGERIEINRFFKETSDDWEEINSIKYDLRKKLDLKRRQND